MNRAALFLSTAMLASPAFAADLMMNEAPMAPMAVPVATGWGGLYVGVQGGAAFNPDGDDALEFSGEGTDPDGTVDGDGGDGTVDGDGITGIDAAFGDNYAGSFDESFTGGAHIGYDFQFSSIVLGAVADIRAMSVEQEQSAFSATPAFYTERRELDYLATMRARLGYDVGGRFLPYITGGLAYGKVDYEFDTNSAAFDGTDGGDDDDFGYTLGAGVEARIVGGLSVGIEYLYVNLGDSDFEATFSGPAGSPAGNAFGNDGIASTQGSGSDEDFDFHLIEAKLSYRF